jgi:hypothetical protein
MRTLLITAALAGLAGLGLGAGPARAEPVRLDEGGLRAVAAGQAMVAAPAAPSLANVNVAVPVAVDVANQVGVTNQVDVANQVGTGVAVGVNAAVGAFASGVTASGAPAAAIGLGAP